MNSNGRPTRRKAEEDPRHEPSHRSKILDEVLIKRLADLARLGFNYSRMARFHKIEPRTFRRWLTRGRKEETGIYADLVCQLKMAECELMRDCVHGIKTAGEEGKWQAYAWILERRFPMEFADKTPLLREYEQEYGRLLSELKAKIEEADRAKEARDKNSGSAPNLLPG